jgi:hypothetical protein
MMERERRHVERLAERLFEEQKSVSSAVAAAEMMAEGATKEVGRLWLMVVAELKTTHAQVQHARSTEAAKESPASRD